MKRFSTYIVTAFLLATNISFFAACKGTDGAQSAGRKSEDLNAKKMMQGIWIDEEDGEPVFRALNDTLYYPDGTAEPTAFYIADDTLFIETSHPTKYAVTSLGKDYFRFINAEGDKIMLIHSNSNEDMEHFIKHTVEKDSTSIAIVNKKDSTLNFNNHAYRAYTEVNPTRHKVYKQSINSDGVTVDNAFYDNIVSLNIYREQQKIFYYNFQKTHFKKLIPQSFYDSCILENINIVGTNDKGMLFEAILTAPDTYTSYHVNITVTDKGKYSLAI